MSSFETFVNTELPRRPTMLLPSLAGGYDDDPNLPGAPAILQNSPTGTYYLQSDGTLSIKNSSAPGSWATVGSGGGGGGTTLYATELLLLAATPVPGTIGYAQDTGNFWFRRAATWQPLPYWMALRRVEGPYTIMVDPATGDDSPWNDGVSTPLRTFRAALARLPIANQMDGRAGPTSARILLKAGNHIIESGTLASADLGNLHIEGEMATDHTFAIDQVTGGVHIWQPAGNPAWTVDEHVGKLLTLTVDYGPPYGIYDFHYWIIGNGTHDLTVACRSYDPTYYLTIGATVSIQRLATKFAAADGLTISAASMDGWSGGFFFVDFDPTLVPSPLYGGMFNITNGAVGFNTCMNRGNGNPYYRLVNANGPGATIAAFACCYNGLYNGLETYGGNIIASDVVGINTWGIFTSRSEGSTLLLTGIMFLRNTSCVVQSGGGFVGRWYYCDNLYCDNSDIIWYLSQDGQGTHMVLEARDIQIPDPTKIPTNSYIYLGADVQVVLHQWGTPDGVGFESAHPSTTFYFDTTYFPHGAAGTPPRGFSFADLVQKYGGDFDFGCGTRLLVSRSTYF